MVKVSYAIGNNIVKGREYHDVCAKTLEILSNALLQSFGPSGSNTAIYKNGVARYTKDGRSILEDIRFNGVIEEAVREDIKEITRNVDLKVGDGTTSAIILASIMFKRLIENKDTFKNPYEVIRLLNGITAKIAENIQGRVQEFDAEKAYNISMVSTNGDKFISNIIKDIYEKQGSGVYIDVKISNDADTKIKTIDSIVLEDGFSDPSFVNDTINNKVIIHDASIYIFENQIDTPDMVQMLRKIITANIVEPFQSLVQDPNSTAVIIPTVIICPYISRDQATFFDGILSTMNAMPAEAKLPLNVITTPKDQFKVHDIAKLCGCKPIKKYIDPEMYKADVELGIAPTVDTVLDFAGHAEAVISDNASTQFVNPALMYDDKEKTKRSETFTGLIEFIKREIRLAQDNNESIEYIGKMKRRLKALEANSVELYIGGISSTDRDYYKDLVIDAVKNCRSAAKNGCGYGANIEGLLAIYKYNIENEVAGNVEVILSEIIEDSYAELVKVVYRDSENPEELLKSILTDGIPYNVNTFEKDTNILCSIETDVEIFKSVVKIVSILFTCNQFIATSCALANPYQTL